MLMVAFLHKKSTAFVKANWQLLLKLGVIFCVLILSAFLGMKSSQRIAFFICLIFASVFVYMLITKLPGSSILTVLLATFLVPMQIGTGTNVALNSTVFTLAAIFAIWFLDMLVVKKEIHLRDSTINTPVILFLLATTISLVIGMLPWIPGANQASKFAQIGGWVLYAFPVAGFLMVGNLVKSIRWLKIYTWFFLILGGIFLVVSLRYGVGIAADIFFQNGISTGTFWTMLAVVGLGQAFSNNDLNWKWRFLASVISITGLAFGWLRGKEWIAGWLPAVIAVGVMIWMKNWKQGFVIALITALVLIPNFQGLYSQVNTGSQQWSTESRFMTWPIMFELVKIDPIFGIGMANSYHYTSLYPINGYYVVFNSHNNFWDLAVQTGMIGLGLFLWLSFEIFRLGLKVRKQAQDGFSFAYANTAIGLLVGCLVAGMMADWFLPFLYNIGFPGFRTSVLVWLFLGGLMSLDAIQMKSTENAA
jgi:hypothetical protein